jgi:hypothetical protein
LPGIGDADQAILNIPAVIALPIRKQVTVGIEGERLPGQIGELVEIVVARCLG